MKLRRLVFCLGSLTLAFLTPGCQSLFSGYAREELRDAEKSVVRMRDNYLGGSFLVPDTLGVYSAQLNLQKTVFADGVVVISFYARIYDIAPVEIRAGPSLELDLDGVRFTLAGAGSEKLRGPYSPEPGETRLVEAAYWHQVPEEVLRLLPRARVVRIRLLGAKRDLALFCTKQNMTNFRKFITEELRP